MSHLPFTITAYFFNSISVLVDKYLLTRSIPNPLLYIFNISVFSLLILILIPFVKAPSLQAFILASISTILWTSGLYFMFSALKIGQASRVIPVIGTLIPVILLLVSAYSGGVSANEVWAVTILLSGLFLLVLPYFKGKFIGKEILLEVLSSLLFADSYIILRWAYTQENFLSVFVYSRMILIPLILIIFALPKLRKLVLSAGGGREKFSFFSKSGVLFFFGQACGGVAELLLTFSISLANPALVNSLQGTQYVFLLFFSFILSFKFPKIYSERVSKMVLILKILGIILIALGLFALSASEGDKKLANLGITYSPRYASSLGLDEKLAFPKILDELSVKHLRFPLYWDEVEKEQGKYNFTQADYYLSTALGRDVDVILVVGYKQPRWPECFTPEWVKGLSRQQKDQAILDLVRAEVEHFRSYKNIKAWQVENEPLFGFGVCEKVDDQTFERLKKEVALTKKLDPQKRPAIVTDSGELSSWLKTYKISDVLGVTLYRTVWNPLFGMNDYPLPPLFYSLKAKLVKFLTGKNHTPVIISELQAEPWIPAAKNITQVSIPDKMKYFPPKKLLENVEFAKLTGFDEIYLWGTEWWFWMSKNGHPEYMNEAKNIFNPNPQ